MLVVNGRDEPAPDRRRFLMMGIFRRFSGNVPQQPAPQPPLALDPSQLTVVELNGSNGPEVYYPEFVTECVSLQNLEMTMEDDLAVGVKQNLLGMLKKRRSLTVIVHQDDSSDEDSDDDIEHDPTMDPVAWLSDSDLDINYDPKNEELVHEYKYGGYHPVSKGEVYFSEYYPSRQYVILRKLGWGHFSTVWLAKVIDEDEEPLEDYVAIKFVKLNKNYKEAAEDEIRLLKTLQNPKRYGDHLTDEHLAYFDKYGNDDDDAPEDHPGYAHMMKLLDDFTVTGPHGNHICMVFELLGENILHLIYKYKHVNLQLQQSSPPIDDEPNGQQCQGNFKFGKWDPLKKLTKLMLSLGLRSPKKALSQLLTTLSIDLAGLPSLVGSSDQTSLHTALQHFKRTAGGLPLPLVKQIVQQLLQAINYMHHCGVIHTDLKPENILVEIKGINDFLKELEHSKLQEYQRKRLDLAVLTRKLRQRLVNRHNSVGLLSEYGSYRLSKNLMTACGSCPVRCLKPLSRSASSTGQSVTFKDFSFGSALGGPNLTQLSSLYNSPSNTMGSLWDLPGEGDLISVKIADLGNGTFAHKHFTNLIQTRQYRLPEVILRYKTWGALTDLWLLGCIIFELITGDYLFDPHEGKFYDKDEDHLAQVIELLGEYPLDQYLLDCKYTSKYFKIDPHSQQTTLKHIDNLKFWGLEDVFVEKYKFERDDEVKMMSDFISKCLKLNLEERYDCSLLLNHPWLTGVDLKCVNHWQDIPGYTGTY